MPESISAVRFSLTLTSTLMYPGHILWAKHCVDKLWHAYCTRADLAIFMGTPRVCLAKCLQRVMF